MGGLLKSGPKKGDSKEKSRKAGSLEDCSLSALLRNPSAFHHRPSSTHIPCLFVSEGALDDFEKAKPSPAPPPTTMAPDASGPQKRLPGDTAKV